MLRRVVSTSYRDGVPRLDISSLLRDYLMTATSTTSTTLTTLTTPCFWTSTRTNASERPSSSASSASSASSSASSSPPSIFDVCVKASQRDRAAYLSRRRSTSGSLRAAPDPDSDSFQSEVAGRVIERVEDCTRRFRRALVLGGAGSAVVRGLLSSAGVGEHLERVVVADHSAEMLGLAKERIEGMECIERRAEVVYHQMDAGDVSEGIGLGIDAGEPGGGNFDLVVSCLHLHWVNDIPGVMTQCRRLMRPDGFFVAAMLGGETLQEMRIACTLAQQERLGGVAARTSPAVYVRDAGSLLVRAGFEMPAVDVDDFVVKYADVMGVVEHVRGMGEQGGLVMRSALGRDVALAAGAVYEGMFGGHEGGRGYVPATYQVVYMSGWSPGEGQGKAKRRGSATVSFKDLESLV